MIGDAHISFTTTKIGSLLDCKNSKYESFTVLYITPFHTHTLSPSFSLSLSLSLKHTHTEQGRGRLESVLLSGARPKVSGV